MTALFDDSVYATRFTQAEAFVAPPLSVIDAAAGYWQTRKRAWFADYPCLATAIGRDDIGGSGFGHLAKSTDDTSRRIAAPSAETATVFDPVLAELAYTWWTQPGDVVYDPFAGGPARGLVAGALGRRYVGVDISERQVDANESSAAPGDVRWVAGDSTTIAPPACDFVFSCPPYGSLERYSNDPRDLSTMSFDEFRSAYTNAIARAVDALRSDRFAAFVVGNYKERRRLRDLVGLTVHAFVKSGAEYYADIAYVPPVGSAALRAAASFPTTRRPMPRHQVMLVFAKGDPRLRWAADSGVPTC